MTLAMREQEMYEQGVETGRVMGLMSELRKFNVPDEHIYQAIQKQCNLSQEEVEYYMGTGVVHAYNILWLHDPEKMKKGLEVGMTSLWSSLKDFNLDYDIIQKIQKEYNLSEEEVIRYIKMYA